MPKSTPLDLRGAVLSGSSGRSWSAERRDVMVGPRNPEDSGKDLGTDLGKDRKDPGQNLLAGSKASGATRRSAIGFILGAPLLGACAGVQSSLSQFSSPFSSSQGLPVSTG